MGNGDGTFKPAVSSTAGGIPASSIGGVVVADFNGDGKADLAIASVLEPTDGGVAVFLGNGDGTFQPPIHAGIQADQLLVGDFNGDGKVDLAVSAVDGSNNEIGVYALLGNGDGTFQPAKTTGVGPNVLAIGDFNGDGNLDLIFQGVPMSVGGGGTVRNLGVLLGKGDGTFQPATPIPNSAAGGQVVVGDFNGDGVTDLAVYGLTVFLGLRSLRP